MYIYIYIHAYWNQERKVWREEEERRHHHHLQCEPTIVAEFSSLSLTSLRHRFNFQQHNLRAKTICWALLKSQITRRGTNYQTVLIGVNISSFQLYHALCYNLHDHLCFFPSFSFIINGGFLNETARIKLLSLELLAHALYSWVLPSYTEHWFSHDGMKAANFIYAFVFEVVKFCCSEIEIRDFARDIIKSKLPLRCFSWRISICWMEASHL